MKKIYLKDRNSKWKEFDYELLSELSDELKKRNITIGARATIGAWATIGVGATIEEMATIGELAKIGAGATIGARATIGAGATIEKYNSFFADNLYDYPCGAWIEENEEIIQLGCFTRTRKEWEAGFWNNKKEFPNNNSEKSKARLRAFKMCCTFLDLIKNK
jgi:carbonic anhydrase/acetyltransferase-like protein (isoleucine patch superfamily)